MPKIYSEDKRMEIKEELMKKALQLITQYGMKKMSIEELTKGVGIAQGTFYRFFKSKEVLVYEMIQAYEERLQNDLQEVVNHYGYLPRKALREMYYNMFLKDEDNVYRFLKREDLQAFMTRLPVECIKKMGKVQERIEHNLQYAEGKRGDYDIAAIINWIQILNVTVQNKDLLIGEAFEKVVESLIENLLNEIWEGNENEIS